MRDPWFPIAMLLIVVIAIWLGIVGPMPAGFTKWLQSWQTLAAAGVASFAAYIAFRNTTRTLCHAERLETNRRSRKHAAVRAVLPVALSQVLGYAERSARALTVLAGRCQNEALEPIIASDAIVEPFPDETLKTLAEFIEYSDSVDVTVLESTVAWIQIHDARLRGIVQDNRDLQHRHVIMRTEIEGRIIDAATIYAGAAAFFEYARRRAAAPPVVVTWDDVTRALRNMRFWDAEHPRVYQIVTDRAARTTGPFERLNAGNG